MSLAYKPHEGWGLKCGPAFVAHHGTFSLATLQQHWWWQVIAVLWLLPSGAGSSVAVLGRTGL